MDRDRTEYIELSDDESEHITLDSMTTATVPEPWLTSRSHQGVNVICVAETVDEDSSPTNIITPNAQRREVADTELSTSTDSTHEVTVVGPRVNPAVNPDPLHLEYLQSNGSSNEKRSSDNGNSCEGFIDSEMVVLRLSPSQGTQSHLDNDVDKEIPCSRLAEPNVDADVIPGTQDASQPLTGKFKVMDSGIVLHDEDRPLGEPPDEQPEEQFEDLPEEQFEDQPEEHFEDLPEEHTGQRLPQQREEFNEDVTVAADNRLSQSQSENVFHFEKPAGGPALLSEGSDPQLPTPSKRARRHHRPRYIDSDDDDDDDGGREMLISCPAQDAYPQSSPRDADIPPTTDVPPNVDSTTINISSDHDVSLPPFDSHSSHLDLSDSLPSVSRAIRSFLGGKSPSPSSSSSSVLAIDTVHSVSESVSVTTHSDLSPDSQRRSGVTATGSVTVETDDNPKQTSVDAVKKSSISNVTKQTSPDVTVTFDTSGESIKLPENVDSVPSRDRSFDYMQPHQTSTLDDTLIYDPAGYAGSTTASSDSLFSTKQDAFVAKNISRAGEIPRDDAQQLAENPRNAGEQSMENPRVDAPALTSSSDSFEIPCSQRYLPHTIKDPNKVNVKSSRTPVSSGKKKRPPRKLVDDGNGPENEGCVVATSDIPERLASGPKIISELEITRTVVTVRRITEEYRINGKLLGTERWKEEDDPSVKKTTEEIVHSQSPCGSHSTSGELGDISSSSHGSRVGSGSGSSLERALNFIKSRNIPSKERLAPNTSSLNVSIAGDAETRSAEISARKKHDSSGSLYSSTPDLSKLSAIGENVAATVSSASLSPSTTEAANVDAEKSIQALTTQKDTRKTTKRGILATQVAAKSSGKPSSGASGGFDVTASRETNTSPANARSQEQCGTRETRETLMLDGQHASVEDPASLASGEKGANKSTNSGKISMEIPLKSKTSPRRIKHDAPVVAGTLVMARWRDGFYYPGTVSHVTDNACRVRFDDGDSSTATPAQMIVIDRLPIGQSVMVEGDDGRYDPGLVIGYHGRLANVGYVVELDDRSTRRSSRRAVILSPDQAVCLTGTPPTDPTTSTTPSASRANVSLDNIVDSRRRVKSSTPVRASPATAAARETSGAPGEMPPDATRYTTRKGKGRGKRTLESTADEPGEISAPKSSRAERKSGSDARKRKLEMFAPQSTSTPTPSKLPTTPSKLSAKRGEASTVGGVMNSPRPLHRSRTRRLPLGEFRNMSRDLFSSCTFLLSHVLKTDDRRQRDLRLLRHPSDSSTTDSTVEEPPNVPQYDKDQLEQLITAGGGVVIDSFDEIQGVLQDHNVYLLPAGISLEGHVLIEQNCRISTHSPFAARNIAVVSKDAGMRDVWSAILTAAKATVTASTPQKANINKSVFAVVTDRTCTAAVVNKARRLHIQLVSTEWCVQSLILRKLCAFTAIPQYRHDFEPSES